MIYQNKKRQNVACSSEPFELFLLHTRIQPTTLWWQADAGAYQAPLEAVQDGRPSIVSVGPSHVGRKQGNHIIYGSRLVSVVCPRVSLCPPLT